jgi:hypothetical protein
VAQGLTIILLDTGPRMGESLGYAGVALSKLVTSKASASVFNLLIIWSSLGQVIPCKPRFSTSHFARADYQPPSAGGCYYLLRLLRCAAVVLPLRSVAARIKEHCERHSVLCPLTDTRNPLHTEMAEADEEPDDNQYLHICVEHDLGCPDVSYLDSLHHVPLGKGRSDLLDALTVCLDMVGR